MLNPFIDLISNVIFLINLALMCWIILSLLMHFDVVNRSSPIVLSIYNALNRFFEPILARIRQVMRKVLPDFGGMDLSPIVLFLLLHFIDNALYSWFYRI